MRLAIFVLLLLSCSRDPVPVAEEPRFACVNEWKRVADGIDYRMLNCDGERFDLHLVRVDPKVAKIDAAMKEDAKSAPFFINANFFDENARPLGVVMSKGKVLNPLHPVAWQSVFWVDAEGRAGITPVPEWDRVAKHAVTAAQCGPRLVVDGKPNKVRRGEPTLRSGVCTVGADGTSALLFFATPPGALFDVWQMVELASSGLGCRDAMLFDGGPSVQMKLRGTMSVEGDERVPAFVVVAPRSQLKEGAKEDP